MWYDLLIFYKRENNLNVNINKSVYVRENVKLVSLLTAHELKGIIKLSRAVVFNKTMYHYVVL